LRFDGIFSYQFITGSLLSLLVNDFANLSTFGEVRARVERLVLFFDLRGILYDILQFNIVNIIFVNCISHF